MEKSYKCQTSDDSYIDSLFIIFSQSFLINVIGRYMRVANVEKPNILEIGCFNGRLMKFLLQSRIFVNYTGIDVRNDYIERSSLKRDDAKLLCEDITQTISVPDNSIDVCVSTEVLEHIKEEHWHGIFERINKKLKMNGLLALGLPVDTEKRTFHSLEHEQHVGHVNFPVHEKFISLIESKGFVLVKTFPGFTINSNYRFSKEIKSNKTYQLLRERLGTTVARAVFLAASSEETGGGYYIFCKKSTI